MGNFSNFKTIVFFDTETVCLKSHYATDCLLSLSMIKDFSDGRTERKDYKFKLSGHKIKVIDEKALEVNGYNESDWKDAVEFESVASEIAEFIHNCPLVAHNIDFDMQHLRNAFLSCGWQPLEKWSVNKFSELKEKKYSIGKPLICTQALSFLFLPVQSQSLNSLREYFDISKERAHCADTDTEDCRAIFYQMMLNEHSNLLQD